MRGLAAVCAGLALLVCACGGGTAPRLDNPWTWDGTPGAGGHGREAVTRTKHYAEDVLIPALGAYLLATGGLPYRLAELEAELGIEVLPPEASRDAWAYHSRREGDGAVVEVAFCRLRWDQYYDLVHIPSVSATSHYEVRRLRARLARDGLSADIRWSHDLPARERE